MSAPEVPSRRDPNQPGNIPAQQQREGRPPAINYVVPPPAASSGSSEQLTQRPPATPVAPFSEATIPSAPAQKSDAAIPLQRRDEVVEPGQPVPGAVDPVGVALTKNPPNTLRWSTRRDVSVVSSPRDVTVGAGADAAVDSAPRPDAQRVSIVEKYVGPNTTYSIIPRDKSGVEVVVGSDQNAEAVAATVLPAIQEGQLVDVFDFDGISDVLIEQARAEGLPIRVVDSSSMLHLLPTKDAVTTAMEIVKFGSEPEKEFGINLLDKVLTSIQTTADQRGDPNPTLGDVIAGVKYLLDRNPHELQVDYRYKLDQDRLLSDTNRERKFDTLSNLEEQLRGLYARGAHTAELGRMGDSVSTVWRVDEDLRSARDLDTKRFVLLHSMAASLAERELDGLVVTGMQVLIEAAIPFLRDRARQRQVRLVEFINPARIPQVNIDYFGTDRSNTLILMAMVQGAAETFETRFPKIPVMQVESINESGSLGGGSSNEKSFQKGGDGRNTLSGGEGSSGQFARVLAVGRQRVMRSVAPAEELTALQPGQAVARTPDGVVHRPTLETHQVPSVMPDPELLTADEMAFLAETRERSQQSMLDRTVPADAKAGATGNLTPRQQAAERYRRIGDDVQRPSDKKTDAGLMTVLEQIAHNKDMSVKKFLASSQGRDYLSNSPDGQRWLETKYGKEWLDHESRRQGLPVEQVLESLHLRADFEALARYRRSQGRDEGTPSSFYRYRDASHLYRPHDWPGYVNKEKAKLRDEYLSYLATARANGNRAHTPRQLYRERGMETIYDARDWLGYPHDLNSHSIKEFPDPNSPVGPDPIEVFLHNAGRAVVTWLGLPVKDRTQQQATTSSQDASAPREDQVTEARSERTLEELDMRSQSDRWLVYAGIHDLEAMGDEISDEQRAFLKRLKTWMESARIGDHYPRNQDPLKP